MNLTNNNTQNKQNPTFFNIATHNTRSLLDVTKQKILFDFYSTNNLDIITVQETNFNAASQYFSLKKICNNKFIPFLSNEQDNH